MEGDGTFRLFRIEFGEFVFGYAERLVAALESILREHIVFGFADEQSDD